MRPRLRGLRHTVAAASASASTRPCSRSSGTAWLQCSAGASAPRGCDRRFSVAMACRSAASASLTPLPIATLHTHAPPEAMPTPCHQTSAGKIMHSRRATAAANAAFMPGRMHALSTARHGSTRRRAADDEDEPPPLARQHRSPYSPIRPRW